MPRTNRNGALVGELEELIGQHALVDLAEAFGGVRLYVPSEVSAAHEIAKAVGIAAAQKLIERFSPDYIRVPLMREGRAQRYRETGKSNAQIARALGITETGVEKLFGRLRPAEKQ